MLGVDGLTFRWVAFPDLAARSLFPKTCSLFSRLGNDGEKAKKTVGYDAEEVRTGYRIENFPEFTL